MPFIPVMPLAEPQTMREAMRLASRLAVAATLVGEEEAEELFSKAGRALAVAFYLSRANPTGLH